MSDEISIFICNPDESMGGLDPEHCDLVAESYDAGPVPYEELPDETIEAFDAEREFDMDENWWELQS